MFSNKYLFSNKYSIMLYASITISIARSISTCVLFISLIQLVNGA